jgi:hypothetical protein
MTSPVEATLDLKVGDVVEVRSQAEIFGTLDENGELDALPFMPEMLKYVGKRLTVGKVAHKACDTILRSGIHKMENAVHLAGVRCGGEEHGGCQATCLIYWKHSWLRKVEPGTPADVPVPDSGEERLLPLLTIASRRPDAEDGSPQYRCQATEMRRATPVALPLLTMSQYADDVRGGNVGVWRTFTTFLVGLYNRLQDVAPRGLRLKGGKHWGDLVGRAAGKTPTGVSGIQPGDLVRVKSRAEIELTLNPELLNRGMGFDSEMARFCGRTARVARKVDHIIDEHSGKMLVMRSPCLVLEDIICEGVLHANCPRSITPYWREIWLDKVTSEPAGNRVTSEPAGKW